MRAQEMWLEPVAEPPDALIPLSECRRLLEIAETTTNSEIRELAVRCVRIFVSSAVSVR